MLETVSEEQRHGSTNTVQSEDNMTWDDIEREIENGQQSLLVRLLPDSVSNRVFGDLEEKRREHEQRRARTKRLYADEVEPIHSRAETLDNDLTPARERGKPLADDPNAYSERIARALDRLSTVAEDLDDDYLRENELEAIEQTESRLERADTFVTATSRFDTQFEPISERVDTLEEAVTPYVTYDEYLTGNRYTDIERRVEVLDTEIETLCGRVDTSVLAEADTARLDRAASKVEYLAELLDGYNESFVERQVEACDDLFCDIDAAGHDLNRAQREAVVRNDTYNQVIAAAGTGKTFALTYRVAYLVGKQGVSPDRIAALTYTNEAAGEMEERLEEQFGITEVDVRTIHSFAYKIAQEAADSHRTPAQQSDIYNFIESVIREETQTNESAFADHYLQFLYHYDDDFLDRAEFESKADYIAERAEETYETLAGEEVASRAEKVIADFLFTHAVEYQYESIAEWADTASDKGPYRPDFYLPEDDIYIEHWGLDENGEVAPWFSWTTAEYLGKLTWARNEFARSEHTLIDTYDFEHETGHLEDALRHRLDHAGVTLEKMDFEQLVDSTFEYHEKERDITESFAEFVGNAKTFDVAPAEIDARLTQDNLRQYHFGKCGKIMLRRYNDYLDRNDLMDFDDMIYEAIAAIEESPETYRRRYDHLLVDEFQDVALSQIRLVRQFTGPSGAKLFCVGDDWQGIYSFQGSEVQYFIDFENHFGTPTTTYLTENFRCPETVLDAGNDLIRNNDAQLEKEVVAASGRDATPTLHTLDGYTGTAYENRVGEYAADLVERCLDADGDPHDVMILCRYDGGAPYVRAVKDELEARNIPYDGKDDHYRPPGTPQENEDEFDPDAGVSAFSVHQAKGREAEHVILLHAATGAYGFPAADRDDELIAPVQEIETNTIEEERRLFYVAITRAERNLHIVTQKDNESPFVTEIADYLEETQSVAAPGELGTHTTITACVSRLWDDTHEKQQQAGVIEDPTGTAKFVSWVSDEPPVVEKGVWYRFEDLRVDEYNDEAQFVIEADTVVVELYAEETA